VSVFLIAILRVESIYSIASSGGLNMKQLILAALLVYLTRYCAKTKKLHPIWMIALSAVAGIVFQFAA
jgi:hypothetical protein